MYRCYLIRNGRIALGDDIDVDSLEAARTHARALLAAQKRSANYSGFEIWSAAALVYSDTTYADGTAGLVSPFQTPESTILPTWRRSTATPTGAGTGGKSSLADMLVAIESEAPDSGADADRQSRRKTFRRPVRRKSKSGDPEPIAAWSMLSGRAIHPMPQAV